MSTKRILPDEKVPLELTAKEQKLVLDDLMCLEDARKAKMICDQAVQIAESAAQALVAATQLRIKTKPLERFWLAPGQRDVLLLVPSLSKTVRKKLASDKLSFTLAEVASMTTALAEDLPDRDAGKQVAFLLVAKHLADRLHEGIAGLTKTKASRRPNVKSKAASGILYQFKITLLDVKPPIWRRIQVRECTLDKLHEHIQTAMGWTNSHLHQFEINGERYGDPELLDHGFEEFDCVDSANTMISDIVPASGKRFVFRYEYDFGDGWEHEILFEGRPPLEKGKKDPVCVEGERACPPEDVGGAGGYQDFVAAIADPGDDDHERLLEWCGGSFSPCGFDPAVATKAMKKGLPDWRRM